MEKKVYEGYKRTSSGAKTTSTKSSVAKVASSAKKSTVSPSKSITKTTTKPSAKPANKVSSSKPHIAMFIDVDNVGISRENLMEILFYANGKYQIDLCKLYGFSDETLPGIRDIANEYNVILDGKMKFKQPGVNCLDSRLLIDAYECAVNNKGKIDMIFVWCYPCDLTNLFEKIIALGINTSTINNSVFDCKNKFVSQTFKLYSTYNFTTGQSMYGKVSNEPTNITLNDNHFETVSTPAQTVNEVIPSSVSSAQSSVQTQTSTQTIETKPTESALTVNENKQNSVPQPAMVDGVIPPVLPRRTVLERHNPNAPKIEPELKPEPVADNEKNDEQASAVVEDIARKLNLQVPNSNNNFETENLEENDDSKVDSSLFIDMLKQAGLGDLLGEKNLKYEDTIGDL